MAAPLQSQIMNVLPRRLLASLWASQETRLSLNSFFYITFNIKQPLVTTQSFLCEELPIRYSHILRLISTLSPDQLQTPMIRHVAHRYLHDMCTLLHPSLRHTSDRAFTDLIRKLRTRQAANLILTGSGTTAASTSAALMDHINTVGLGIQFLTEQHQGGGEIIKEDGQVQTVKPVAIAMQAVEDARQLVASCLGRDVPAISIQEQPNLSLTFIPHVLHRMIFETTLITLRARILEQQQQEAYDNSNFSSSSWRTFFQRTFHPKTAQQPIQLSIFGGPTSVGFRLTSPSALLPNDLKHDVPRDPLGIPTCTSVLGRTTQVDNRLYDDAIELEHQDVGWHVWSGWRATKTLASHWGGNLDVVSVDGLGSTMYLALDRDISLLERYPSKRILNCSAYHLLHHHRRTSAIAASNINGTLSLQAAEDQLSAFLNAISSQQELSSPARKDDMYHHVSLSAAVAAAVGHA
ncbi:hypothetical protein BDA99DRAFT_583751 [Phascolomyces articulosus]|uniref:Protein-serine/threonine kinase n=1 Tax=Phascolomyces articulosus TaxID=60185 RepID=A0AAD5PE08_9FUNG|nr:hypothetical protein BDA99DRAFT_583751 [Phascolomyces articulosus]